MAFLRGHLLIVHRLAEDSGLPELVEHMGSWLARDRRGWTVTEGAVDQAIFMLNNYKSTSQRRILHHLLAARKDIVDAREARLAADGWVD
jgi:hypothetical protein